MFNFIRRLLAGAASKVPPPRAPGTPVVIPGPRPSWLQEAVEAQLERFGHHIERRDAAPGVTPVNSLDAIGAIFCGDAERQQADSMYFSGTGRVSPKFVNNGSVRLPFHKPADHLQ